MHNQCNIDMQICKFTLAQKPKYFSKTDKKLKQKIKIVVTETNRCNFKDFSEKIALHLDCNQYCSLNFSLL